LTLLVLPLVLALISFIIPEKFVRYFGLAGALSSLAVAVGHLSYFNPENYVSLFDPNRDFPLGLSFKMGYDGLSLTMVLLVNAIVAVILLANYGKELAENKTFTALVFFMQMGLLGVFLAQDGILFYIFWEVTLIPIFLILYWFGQQNNNPVLMKFFIYTLLGSLGMLLSFIYLGSNFQSFAYENLAVAGSFLGAKVACWVACGFLLAFAIKIPLFPFHTWQPATYTTAPMAGTMLLSALMLKMALYGMIKWMIPLTSNGLAEIKWIVITLGCIGIVYGAIIAIKQKDIKTLFAYASISHVGLIAAGIILFTQTSLESAIVQIINHSIVAVGLFFAADIIESRTGTRNIYELGGIAKLAPRFGFWFSAMTFVSVSVPFTAGFIGEFLLIKELFVAHWITGLIASTTLVFGAVYMLRAYQVSMFGAPKMTSFEDLKWNEILVFALLTAAAVLIGISPKCIMDFVKPSIVHINELMVGGFNFIK
jgi:NADH-quinone oxidoreductase subunit M